MQMQNVIIYDYFRIHFYILIDVRSKHSSCALGIFYSLFFLNRFFTLLLLLALKCLWMLLNVYECLMVIDDY